MVSVTQCTEESKTWRLFLLLEEKAALLFVHFLFFYSFQYFKRKKCELFGNRSRYRN